MHLEQQLTHGEYHVRHTTKATRTVPGTESMLEKKMCYHFIVNAIMTKYPWNIPPEHSELIYSMTIAYSLIFFFIRKHKRISDEVVLKKILRKTMQNYFISKVKTKRCYRLCFQNPSATRHNDTDTTLWNPVLKSCVYGLLRFLPISRIKLFAKMCWARRKTYRRS